MIKIVKSRSMQQPTFRKVCHFPRKKCISALCLHLFQTTPSNAIAAWHGYCSIRNILRKFPENAAMEPNSRTWTQDIWKTVPINVPTSAWINNSPHSASWRQYLMKKWKTVKPRSYAASCNHAHRPILACLAQMKGSAIQERRWKMHHVQKMKCAAMRWPSQLLICPSRQLNPQVTSQGKYIVNQFNLKRK